MTKSKGWHNRATEVKKGKSANRNAAERYVFNQLKKDGRKPGWAQTGKGYDIFTRNMRIEVKGRKQRALPPNFISLSHNMFRLGKDLDKFWLYVVLGMGVKGKWKTVIKIPAKELLPRLSFHTQLVVSNKQLRAIAKKQGIKVPSRSEREDDEVLD